MDLVTDALAALRLTRLITTDKITEPARVRALVWLAPRYPLAAEGIECDWCVGVWAGFAVQVLPRWARRALAAAQIVGIITSRERST